MTKENSDFTMRADGECTCGMASTGMAYNPMDECWQHAGARGFAEIVERMRDAEAALREWWEVGDPPRYAQRLSRMSGAILVGWRTGDDDDGGTPSEPTHDPSLDSLF